MLKVETDLTAKLTALKKKIRRAGFELEPAVENAVRTSVRRFKVRFAAQQLSRRTGSSLGIRTGRLKSALQDKVTIRRKPHVVTGRVNFGRKDSFANMVARVHEYGRVIKPKASRFLVYPMERRFSRYWIFKGTDKVVIRTRKPSRIPPRLGMRTMWRQFAPVASKFISRKVKEAIKKGLMK